MAKVDSSYFRLFSHNFFCICTQDDVVLNIKFIILQNVKFEIVYTSYLSIDELCMIIFVFLSCCHNYVCKILLDFRSYKVQSIHLNLLHSPLAYLSPAFGVL